ncbi:PREDICTED: uncharacterized protein LOC105965904 [Erythranthe guttata]|uniref:uncharacterized protein LOC105965904 n=1 Tax=Erythranthe guttata TaxID=4155 RepID=UPI00064DA372|nr:PREDICTED: uncharacterized protein LOC105965904 [Erythranthe guttata]|eukprot:XP_012845905.1 PREDICTED: uncharacterized protein LOC105965904 [Erythranthe guttata]
MVICWKAWDARNREAHGEEGMRGRELWSWSKNYLDIFRSASTVPTILKNPPPRVHWIPPPDGTIKVNFDAALPPSLPHYRVAMVARDFKGIAIWWSVDMFLGTVQAVEGEAHAALKAIQKSKTKGWASVIIEGDCRQLISAIDDEDSTLCPIGAYVEDIRALMLSFNSCQFSFVPRNCNKLAHALANSIELANLEGPILPLKVAHIA